MNLRSIAALALAEDAAANQGGAAPSAPSNPDFESKHPRGNSANKGQFRKSEKTLAKLDEADAIVSTEQEETSSFDWSKTCNAKDWSANGRSVDVVKIDSCAFNESMSNSELRKLAMTLAYANVRSQPNYIGESPQAQPQMALEGKVYRITAGGIKHGLRRAGRVANAYAGASIGDLLNNSVQVPNTPIGINYRLAAMDFGEGLYFVNITSRISESIEEVVEVDVLHAINAKRDAGFHGMTRTDISSGADIVSNFPLVWQSLFLDGIVRLSKEGLHAPAEDAASSCSVSADSSAVVSPFNPSAFLTYLAGKKKE